VGAHIRIVLLTVPREDAEAAADALWAAGTTAVEERAGPTTSTATLVADVAPAALRPGWRVEYDDVDAGLDAWRKHARAWVAGPFVVRPPWVPPTGADRVDRSSAAGAVGAPGSIELVIDPGHAFGSGSHPTTRLALEALAATVRPGAAVLDVGCGSGVLSVAAARLGAVRVDAVDIDAVARDATAANASANGVAVRILAVDRIAGPGDVAGPYDVVVANITAAALRELARPLAGVGATYVLTGVLDDQVDDVAAAFTAAGMAEASRSSEDGWSAVIVRSTP
jgi:ribosomal protein L11 methyltransferase